MIAPKKKNKRSEDEEHEQEYLFFDIESRQDQGQHIYSLFKNRTVLSGSSRETVASRSSARVYWMARMEVLL